MDSTRFDIRTGVSFLCRFFNLRAIGIISRLVIGISSDDEIIAYDAINTRWINDQYKFEPLIFSALQQQTLLGDSTDSFIQSVLS